MDNAPAPQSPEQPPTQPAVSPIPQNVQPASPPASPSTVITDTPQPPPALAPTPPSSPNLAASNPQRPTTASAAPALATTPISAEEDVEHTLSTLHHHQRVTAIIISGVVLTLTAINIVLCFHVLAVRHTAYENLTSTKARKVQQTFGSDVENRPDGTIDMSKKIDDSLAEKNQNIKAGLKQQVNLSNGLSFMVTDVQKDWHPLSTTFYTAPDPGYQYYKVSLAEGNRGSNEQVFPFAHMTIVDANGKLLVSSPLYYPLSDTKAFGPEVNDLATSLDTLQPGDTANGVFVVKVPKTGTSYLHTETTAFNFATASLTSSGNTGDVTMKVDIKL